MTPRTKVLLAAGLLSLAGLAPVLARGASAASPSAVLLTCGALGLVAWALRSGVRWPGRFASTPRLAVVQRVGLSQRAGLALVEVDGHSYLVVHGDGFARIRPARRPRPVPAPGVTP